jgi:hypothetical protein
MKVQMADGVIVEMFKNEKGTLVSQREIQTIIPLVPVLQCLGFKLKKRKSGMTLEREDQNIQLRRDQGVLECGQEDGQKLMTELENNEGLTWQKIEKDKETEEDETEVTSAMRTVIEQQGGLGALKGLREYLEGKEGADEEQETEKEKET